jgi:NTE family protein
MFARYRPRIPCAITVTGVPRLRKVLVPGERVTAAHLMATCAIPFGYPPVRIEGKLYVDGGLLDALPVWAAVEMGATSVVAVNALPLMPSALLRAGVRLVRVFAPLPEAFPGLERIDIRPPGALGSVRDAIVWNEANIRRWIRLGEEHARAAGVPGLVSRDPGVHTGPTRRN